MKKKAKGGAAYDLKTETMMALVVPRPWRNRVERAARKSPDKTMKAFVMDAVNKKLAGGKR